MIFFFYVDIDLSGLLKTGRILQFATGNFRVLWRNSRIFQHCEKGVFPQLLIIVEKSQIVLIYSYFLYLENC